MIRGTPNHLRQTLFFDLSLFRKSCALRKRRRRRRGGIVEFEKAKIRSNPRHISEGSKSGKGAAMKRVRLRKGFAHSVSLSPTLLLDRFHKTSFFLDS